MTSIVNWSIQIAYATASQWTSWDGVLLAGQEGAESDTGKRKIGDGSTNWSSLPYLFASSITSTTGITAHAGGGQSLATQLTTQYNRIDTVATDGDSVKCISALVNSIMNIINNDSAQSMDVFPAIGNQFLGQAPNTAISISAGNQLNILCFENGIWTQI